MNGLLADQVALVTRAARGQGRAIVTRLAEEGVDVIGVDVTERAAVVAALHIPGDPTGTATRRRRR